MWIIRLPWPERALWQNSLVHWSKQSKATREARRAAWALALQEKLPTLPNAKIEFSYFPPDRRRRDVQNMPATLKGYIDGIADAMGCDDSGFRPMFPDGFSEPVKGGAVLAIIKDEKTDGWRSIGEIAAATVEAVENERMVRSQEGDQPASPVQGKTGAAGDMDLARG